MFGISEIAILLIVVIVLLGARKLPELARNAGKAARILKSETRAMKDDGAAREPRAVYEVTTPRPTEGGTAPSAAAPPAHPGTHGSPEGGPAGH
ncbi:twin-arginine translocase TatA/TatE family subunit [Streptomyces sp. NPDC048338]|uniref:twin-arginine translocase TatA/TatE family subunit n=1 Tax=Streptomyces sp. NPDC048338 TaxID=3365536 RepID=UPI0037182247